tara:strand:- start:6208 stop:6762 length:555 start_codon:yes stop_codon:yes gene_type:complete
MLDASEQLHLAIHASNEGNHHAALSYLKDALKTDPDNAQVLYFLAAEHAELGLYERAKTEMEAALKAAPDLDIARFQLGLLCLQLQNTEDASKAFEVIANDSSAPDLKLFAAAYLRIIASDPAEATDLLKSGLEACENKALRGDMQRVIASLSGATNEPELGAAQADESPAVFLGAYRNVEEPN